MPEFRQRRLSGRFLIGFIVVMLIVAPVIVNNWYVPQPS
jgi:hypothetical protein